MAEDMDFPGGSDIKCLPTMRETQVQSLGWVDPLEEMATHYLYSCLGNRTDGGAWRAPVHRVTKSQARLSTEAEKRAQVALGEAWLCALGVG